MLSAQRRRLGHWDSVEDMKIFSKQKLYFQCYAKTCIVKICDMCLFFTVKLLIWWAYLSQKCKIHLKMQICLATGLRSARQKFTAVPLIPYWIVGGQGVWGVDGKGWCEREGRVVKGNGNGGGGLKPPKNAKSCVRWKRRQCVIDLQCGVHAVGISTWRRIKMYLYTFSCSFLVVLSVLFR